ncbi:hypothetical protein EMIHUDRAFT_240246 [Emiliania huxleyi CCMP1516]|uniref:JmjC domain-containing protein n=2 Tax=Emiliania huxleyi TaxID=2903 RepID=A0A0D3JG47_EMIH1|nr:hypothetical protein EMIHUDRAFT_240246 [Emiliania huxleyi CCMP1516]EOD22482.1 hypothetical protein EMIHUDRAFT_240246 [Emiliania huxleyi CCMP1516]|eukprot:XP_005774911.1 hypothetical protein EMIHUDRAFT_240246 [Emiliania huxleyi CCMP1516]
MSLRDFLDAHTAGGGEARTGYLAQHPLFEQIPRLRRDFRVPELCTAGGGSGTVTPLHFDSYDNVVGYKRVVLFPAEQTKWLYPKEAGGGGVDAQGNVSAVDAPDLERFPDYARAAGLEAVLGPGDGLYIPAGCWHHVRSLTAAFSVSFWF